MKKITLLLCLLLATFFPTLAAFASDEPSDNYTQEKEYIKKYVWYAKTYIEKNGKVAAVTDFNRAKFDTKNKGLYIFGFVCGSPHADGFYLINPGIPSRIYQDYSNEALTQNLKRIAMTNPDGAWWTYQWLNPAKNQVETKQAYVLFLPKEQLCIGSGFYY